MKLSNKMPPRLTSSPILFCLFCFDKIIYFIPTVYSEINKILHAVVQQNRICTDIYTGNQVGMGLSYHPPA